MDQYTRARIEKTLAMIKVLHKLANPSFDTTEQAEKGRIVWDAVKEALGDHSYADILSAQVTLELMLEGK